MKPSNNTQSNENCPVVNFKKILSSRLGENGSNKFTVLHLIVRKNCWCYTYECRHVRTLPLKLQFACLLINKLAILFSPLMLANIRAVLFAYYSTRVSIFSIS